jgi:hypothetical protein
MPTAQGSVNLQSPEIFRSWILCRTWKQNNFESNARGLNKPFCCCRAAARLASHPLALAELPVLEIVSGIHIVADLTLGLGKVVHDYLA